MHYHCWRVIKFLLISIHFYTRCAQKFVYLRWDIVLIYNRLAFNITYLLTLVIICTINIFISIEYFYSFIMDSKQFLIKRFKTLFCFYFIKIMLLCIFEDLCCRPQLLDNSKISVVVVLQKKFEVVYLIIPIMT